MFREEKFGQGKCQGCHGWHWAIQLNDKMQIIEAKCCRCGRIIKIENGNITQVINVGKLKE